MAQHRPADGEYASTYQAAEAMGVGVSTVKRWVDEGLLPADRTAGGHRKLRVADLRRLVRDGEFPNADLSRLESDFAVRRPLTQSNQLSALASALADGAADRVRGIIRAAYFGGGLRIEQIADSIIAPAMAEVGHDWQSGRLNIFHEHRGTRICLSALVELKAELERRAGRDCPVGIGGAPDGDHYLLPTLLAQMALRDAGWDAIDIGPNTPMTAFAAAIREHRPRLLWISVSYLPHVTAFIREFNQLYRLAHRHGVAVIVGGRALSKSILRRISYSAHGEGLAALTAFAANLHPARRRPRRGRPPAT